MHNVKTQFHNELLSDLMELLSEDYEKIKENLVRNDLKHSYEFWRGYAQGLLRSRDLANTLIADHFKDDEGDT